jgi:hypothetical protein
MNIEPKDLLNAEIQLLSIASFLFVSSCAGFGFLITLANFGDNILLQCLSVITGIFVVLLAFWGITAFINILKLKN